VERRQAMAYTQLGEGYWRYLIGIRGRRLARIRFHAVFSASRGVRRYELQRTYLKVFREMPAGGEG